MNNSSSAKKCKKKRKFQLQLKRCIQRARIDYNQFRNAFQKAGNLRPCNPSSIKHALWHLDYKFIITRSIKRNIRAIKRTIINESVTKVQNTNRISINDRIGNTGSSEICEKFDLRCSNKFLEGRIFKMANSSENSTNSNDSFSKVSITFEQMLNIRRKRLDKKHCRLHKKTDPVVEVEDESDTTVCRNEQNDCFEVVLKEVNQNYDVIEIKDDSNIIDFENNNMEMSCGIKHDVDQTEEIKDVTVQQLDGTNVTPEISNHVERIDQNISHEEVNSTEANNDIIDLDLITINDSVINMRPAEIPSEESLNKMSIDDDCDQSVIIVRQNDVPNPQLVSKKRLTRWSSANSVIAISDTSSLCQNFNDDIIFVSEECRSAITPSAKQRRLDRKPSVVIIDDDRLPVSRQNTNYSRKKKRRKKVKKKKHGCRVTRTSPKSTFASELAGCADIHCVNATNCNQAATSQTDQPCACQQSKDGCPLAPCLLTIPEQSATIAQNNHDSHESINELYLQNNFLHLNSMNNKFGSNIHNAGYVVREGLRQIIIDGSNIALGHSNGREFSVKGLQIAIDYFIKKGHKVKAFVPQYRLKFGQCTNPHVLRKLIDERLVILTPSREVKGRRITPYDDRYIIQYATTCEGIVVSNDNYRDLLEEKPEWRQTIERRLLMYTWVDDILIFPEDPLGRHGPNLSRFLRFP